MRRTSLKKKILVSLSADVFVHVIFVIFSLSRLPCHQIKEGKKFDTFEEMDDRSP